MYNDSFADMMLNERKLIRKNEEYYCILRKNITAFLIIQ